eukprot:COSAG02_NODE_4857_length_4897_cov_5.098166_4_plen_116_part_00
MPTATASGNSTATATPVDAGNWISVVEHQHVSKAASNGAAIALLLAIEDRRDGAYFAQVEPMGLVPVSTQVPGIERRVPLFQRSCCIVRLNSSGLNTRASQPRQSCKAGGRGVDF